MRGTSGAVGYLVRRLSFLVDGEDGELELNVHKTGIRISIP
jgi:hypothetical protein